MKKSKATAVLIPANVLADLDCAVFTNRSTGDLFRLSVKLPSLNDFIITSDLEPTAKFFESHYGLNREQAVKAAEYLSSLPNKRAAVERRKRAEARKENSDNSWSNWRPVRSW